MRINLDLIWVAIIAVFAVLWILLVAGCGGIPVGQQASQRAEAGRDVLQESRQQESAVETETARDVSTTRFGLDEATKAVLDTAISGGMRLLGKLIGTVMLVGVGFALVLLFSDAPGGLVNKSIGIWAGLATMIGGPILLWVLI